MSIGHGGSGGTRTSLLVSFDGGIARELVSRQELNAGLGATIEYQNGFRAVVTESRTGQSITVDLSSRKADYLRLGIYDASGKLLKPVAGLVDGYGVFVPVRLPDGAEVFEGRQLVSGAHHADGLAVLASTWTLKDGHLQLQGVRVLPLGPGGGAHDPVLDNQPAPSYPVGRDFAQPGVLPADQVVLDSRWADMNGDGARDSVLLLGRPGPDGGSMWRDVYPAVVDGATGALTAYPLNDGNAGYSPQLWIGFLGDATQKDILVRIESGGSGGTSYYSLFTLKDGLLVPVVDPATLTAGISQEASVRFLPGFLVEVRIPSTHVQWTLDVSDRRAEYTALGLYDEEGRLLTSREGWVDPLVSLIPVDENGDGIGEALIGEQLIAGAAHVDRLGTVESRWQVSGDRLILQSVRIQPNRIPTGS